MGFAKYAEDNFEIMEERHFWMQANATTPTLLRPQISVSIIVPNTPQITEYPIKIKTKKKTKKLVCCECGTSFLFTGGEQNYYEKHKLHEPKRCPTCRKNRKKEASIHKEEEV